jgi:flagellar biosynthesis/type III secretory pathway chaperone
MTPLVNELVGVLEQETSLLADLIAILQTDQQRIIKRDIDGLEQSNLAKEDKVLHFQSLEVARCNATQRLGSALGIAPDEMRVSRLCGKLGPDGQPLLASADKLRAAVASLGELLSVSRGFLEQSILGVRGMLSLLQTLRTPSPGGYDATGRMARTVESEPTAIRREV